MHHARIPLLVLCLMAFGTPSASAHGEFDESMLDEFHLHLDDFREDVQHLVEALEPVLEAHAEHGDTDAATAELIEEWEEVGVHAAIETRATPLYPGIWQALVALQQAAGSGRSAAEVRAAADDVEAALWQGFGAVRLAASRVEAGTAPETAEAGDDPPRSGPETVDRIVADLEQAVAAYRSDELERAEQLIHRTYLDRFEGLEGDLIARDAELVTRLERDFNATLPLLMQQGAPLEEVNETLASMKDRLETARDILEDVEQSRSEVF